MMQRQMPEQHITIYIDVPSVDEYADKVKRLGGQVVFRKPCPEWDTLRYVSIRRITVSAFGRLTQAK